MTANTPVYGWPYPTAGDPLADVRIRLSALALAIESTLTGFGGIAAPGAWTVVPLAAGSSPGEFPTIAPARYRKVGSEVILRGIIGGLGGGLSAGSVFATLPVGFRPTNGTMPFLCVSSGSLASARVDVQTDGKLVMQTSLAAGGWFVLNGIRFFTD